MSADGKPKTLREMWREEATIVDVFDRIEERLKALEESEAALKEFLTALEKLARERNG